MVVPRSLMAVWHSGGSIVSCINKVTPHRAWLVLGWVTTSTCQTTSVCNQSPRPTQPGCPSLGGYSHNWCRFLPPLGKKRRILHNSRPCDEDWRHTNLVG